MLHTTVETLAKGLRFLLMCSGLIACWVLLSSGSQLFADSSGRSHWIWSDVFGILNNSAQRDQALDFMQSRGIDTAYLWLDLPTLQNEPEKYRSTIAEMHARGMQAYVLDGDPSFVLPVPGHDQAIDRFESVLQFNSAAAPNERFDGAHFDNEPWALPQWNTNPSQFIQQYLALSTEYIETRDSFGSSIAIAADVPFLFAASQFPYIANTSWDGETKILHQHVQDIYDEVTLLDYRDFALGIDSIDFHAQPWLDYGDQIGKPVEIGVETGPSSIDKVTFAEEGALYLDSQLALAETHFLPRPSFDGFAIHHFGSYQPLVLAEALAADYNGNGFVDQADYTVWLDSLGQSGTGLAADGNNDQIVDQADYNLWKAFFGTPLSGATSANATIPEPQSLTLLCIAVAAIYWGSCLGFRSGR